MRKAFIAALAIAAALPVASPAAAADDAYNSQGLRKAVTLDGVREHQAALQAVADANGGTRASGTPGYAASAAYVRGRLEAAGYVVTEQQFSFPWATTDQSRLVRISPDPKTYTVLTDFRRFTTGSTDGAVTAPIQVPPGSQNGCTADAFIGFVPGNIALIERGPAGCTFNAKATNAKAAGAVGVLIYNNAAGPAPANLTIANPDGTAFSLPALITSQAVGQELQALAASGPVTVDMEAKQVTEFRQTTNLWVETSGDPDRTVVVGAHLDSVPAGPGINDNGSGSAGILEIAEQYAARDLEPRNRIRFMWFGAEERGLLGSNHYVDSLSQAEKDQILLNLNFDMIGSPNGARLVYDGDNSAFPVGAGSADGPEGSGLIEGVFASYFRNQGLSYAPTPFSGRSDYGRFISNGIPAGGLFTGAEGPCTAALRGAVWMHGGHGAGSVLPPGVRHAGEQQPLAARPDDRRGGAHDVHLRDDEGPDRRRRSATPRHQHAGHRG